MSVFSGETPFDRTNSLSTAFSPGNRGLAGQNAGIIAFIRGNVLWPDKIIFDKINEHIQRKRGMLRGDVPVWQTVLARLYFGEGDFIAFR